MHAGGHESAELPIFTKERAEEYLRKSFGPTEQTSTAVPPYLPTPDAGMSPIGEVTVTDIKEALVGKNGAASPGEDGLQYWMLRQLDVKVHQRIASCFTRIIEGDDEVPNAWGEVRVRMIFKGKGADPTDIDNFRPVSVTSIMAKVLNAVVKSKLESFCRAHGIIDQQVQKGFQPKVSGCVDHINAVYSCLRDMGGKRRRMARWFCST